MLPTPMLNGIVSNKTTLQIQPYSCTLDGGPGSGRLLLVMPADDTLLVVVALLLLVPVSYTHLTLPTICSV